MPRREFWGLDDSIGYLARIVFRRFTGAFEKRTLPHGISMGQYALLRSLWNTDGIAQHNIAVRLGLCEPTVAVTARRPENLGLLRRRVNSSNRRETLEYLTQQGRDLEPLPMCASQAARAAAIRNLSVPEVATLHALLCRVERNLATFEAALIDVES
ncbi:transcriptional regulator, MarR family [Sphingopyxis sp. YR583]|jgi:DNA-binding MarR family transcriptional regulator|uniref:MarR family transcriptional regulator n=1 Tax=Sphingopyxis sp. YR583 TaxID=1881047 RepID=UPI0008A77F06|nr:MarR family transcriptional regulator [Sphingopyxis sp. YR583]SEH11536.1 transcriptional regulator, MarR family [Sphingopyxis sp. YR583]